MKRLALFAVVIALAAGVSATAASAGDKGNQTPGCQNSAWTFTLTGDFGTLSYLLNPVVKCAPTAGNSGASTLSGVAFVTDASGLIENGCTATISGTLRHTDLSADWTWDNLCTGEVTTLTGTLHWGTTAHPTTGSGSGTWTDNFAGSGTWTADRLS